MMRVFLLHIHAHGEVEIAGRALAIQTARLTGGIVNGPTYKAEVIDRVIFARWASSPTKEDVTAFLAQIQDAAKKVNSRCLR